MKHVDLLSRPQEEVCIPPRPLSLAKNHLEDSSLSPETPQAELKCSCRRSAELGR